MATSRRFVALALLAPLAASGCDDGPAPPLFARLARPTLEPATLRTAPLEPRMIEVCGDVRPAFVVTSGAPLYLELPTLRATAWLDVAAAALPEGNSPPPNVRLRVERRAHFPATAHELLYDGLPSPGRTPAFGWGEARVELSPPRERLEELVMSVELAEPLPAGAALPTLVIAVPRLAERAVAGVRPTSWIEWRCELPSAAALPSAAELEQLLAVAAAQLLPLAAVEAVQRPPFVAPPFVRWESLQYGNRSGSLPAYDAEVPLDRLLRFDGAAAPGPVATALPGLAAWGEAVLAERQRQLGEHRLFLEIARPRHAPLHVQLVTCQPLAPALAALRRLTAHVNANDLADRTWLDVTFVATDGARIAFRRRPAVAPHEHG